MFVTHLSKILIRNTLSKFVIIRAVVNRLKLTSLRGHEQFSRKFVLFIFFQIKVKDVAQRI